MKGAPPFVLADLGGTPLVGLPGNPLGAVMIIQRVLLPMLKEDFGLTLPRREVVMQRLRATPTSTPRATSRDARPE